MFRREKYLALCDKASQIVQIACMANMFPKGHGAIQLGEAGRDLIVIVVDTLGNNAAAAQHLRASLDDYGLTKASIVHFGRGESIYTGDFSTQDGIQRVLADLRSRYPSRIAGIFCALLSQRFVKAHLDAFPDAPIFMLEDGLASYLEMPIKACARLIDSYAHKGDVLAHLKRVKLANLPLTEGSAPSSHLQKRYVQLDLGQQKLVEMKAAEKCYIGLNPERRAKMHAAFVDFWKGRARDLRGGVRPQAILLGQNFSDFCKGFYFRDEVEMYADACRRLFKLCDRVMFIPHPKSPSRLADLISERVTGELLVHRDPSIPAEAFFVRDERPSYAVGYYSTAMWNIQEILGAETYTALGWSTRQLYAGLLQYDIQRQAYRAARQTFFPLEKLEVYQKTAQHFARVNDLKSEEILAEAS
ncbi:polysialyltransferase family glycosyltransferase [Sinorhizobium fredii]|uniref:polysialyltransferase family glycosyltransferase n=1 Tax=Rhizobium fredii TaxID=380 RepID=UPI000595707F|nr:polysialyltransferase family glycosyltransferase [Sinorhizobium fredii]WOS65245.1 polysialyltransferase family glycosyltransferase [Sinorhizobium fredii GR64]